MDGGDGQRRAAAAAILYWPERRRTGHKENDKEARQGYASESRQARRGRWRDMRHGGGRSAWREGAERAHTRCLTTSRPAEHARERTLETKQRTGLAWEVSEMLRGG
jgi:hypothetical protein